MCVCVGGVHSSVLWLVMLTQAMLVCRRYHPPAGLEKVERNVLPVLNNLLENREMQLEDGRFLVAPKRFDELLKTNKREYLVNELKLLRVHENFRVIALGVPVPPFPGNP